MGGTVEPCPRPALGINGCNIIPLVVVYITTFHISITTVACTDVRSTDKSAAHNTGLEPH